MGIFNTEYVYVEALCRPCSPCHCPYRCAIAAQEAADGPATNASADLVLMRKKADADPVTGAMFQQVERSIGQTDQDSPRRFEDIVAGFVFRNVAVRGTFGRVPTLKEPVKIATLEGLEPARQRAESVSQVLAADLDGDWQITRDEILETAKYHRIDAAAQAFITADADRNDVLSFEEIKVAVAEMAGTGFGRPGAGPNLMTVFDFNDDGYLTQPELDRGVAALSP